MTARDAFHWGGLPIAGLRWEAMSRKLDARSAAHARVGRSHAARVDS
jgi:hypothetical protein